METLTLEQDVEPVLVALRQKADHERDESGRVFYHAVADRILGGYVAT